MRSRLVETILRPVKISPARKLDSPPPQGALVLSARVRLYGLGKVITIFLHSFFGLNPSRPHILLRVVYDILQSTPKSSATCPRPSLLNVRPRTWGWTMVYWSCQQLLTNLDWQHVLSPRSYGESISGVAWYGYPTACCYVRAISDVAQVLATI